MSSEYPFFWVASSRDGFTYSSEEGHRFFQVATLDLERVRIYRADALRGLVLDLEVPKGAVPEMAYEIRADAILSSPMSVDPVVQCLYVGFNGDRPQWWRLVAGQGLPILLDHDPINS